MAYIESKIMTKNIISLTAIPSRFDGLLPTLTSLHNQTADIDQIILYIPKIYRRDQFNPYTIPQLPKWCEIRILDMDYGPATKILGAVKEFENQDVRLLYCDDDRIYHPNWAAELIKKSEENPEKAICAYGSSKSDFLNRNQRKKSKNWRYRLKRAASFGLWKPEKKRFGGDIIIAQGYAGVLVKPSFFADDVYDIPDMLWAVDDIWLSGHLAKNGILIEGLENGADLSEHNMDNRVDELRKATLEGANRHEADKACFDYYQKKYNVWK